MMRKIVTSLCCGAALALGLSCQPNEIILDSQPCEFPTDLSAYELSWSDEFEGTEINRDIWTFEIGDGCDRNLCGWGNNELEWYTDRKANARVSEGSLVIRALKESTPFNGYDYTSARLVTKNKADFKYGRMDIRARLPKGKGLWPAIWMLSSEEKYKTNYAPFASWPASGEIDIMELLGDKPNEVLGTVHYGADAWKYKSAYFDGPDFSADFHVFTLLWRENCLRFMVDGELYGDPISPSTTLPQGYPFNEYFHFILNVAVGGNLPGNPDATTSFPQDMTVDYVRVYQEK
ncbi:MAG: glycoside hydrolase family 16 protein [Bacteroidota bacterium]